MAEPRTAPPPAPAGAQVLTVAAVGVSTTTPCGVRDHAGLLADALSAQGVRGSLHWLAREERSLRAERRRMRAWLRELSGALATERPDAILLHYSVFSYAHRGVPLFVAPTLAALRAGGAPIVSVLHEYAYPWRRNGVRGLTWAITQRATLLSVMRASAGVFVTTDWRVDWLNSRAWLPRRPIACAPVFSNLPEPGPGAQPRGVPPVIGLFGYTHEPDTIALALDAIAVLRERSGQQLRLALIGAPGPASALAQEWLRAARERGLDGALEFSGTLPAQELSDRVASCEVLLSLERSGPTSRKTTLAASLAAGRPLVALDGPRSWRALSDANAALVVEPSAPALADALAALLADEQLRQELGARGREFARANMSAEHSARLLAGLLRELLAPGS